MHHAAGIILDGIVEELRRSKGIPTDGIPGMF